MDKPDVTAKIDPVRLGPDSEFQFECHKGVKRFNQCCRCSGLHRVCLLDEAVNARCQRLVVDSRVLAQHI